MIPFLDVVGRERCARDAMIRDGAIPLPDAAARAALLNLGIRIRDDGARAVVTLPAGWSAKADPLDHRCWHLVDGKGVPRVECFWKDSGYDPPGGSVWPMPEQRVRRTWEAHGTEVWAMDRKARLTLSCARCSAPHEAVYTFSAEVFEWHPATVVDVVSQAEGRFLREHVCQAVEQPHHLGISDDTARWWAEQILDAGPAADGLIVPPKIWKAMQRVSSERSAAAQEK